MKYRCVLAWLLMLTIQICAIGQETVGCAGGEASGPDGSVSYSIGQVVYGSVVSATGSISEGVQQTYASISTVIDENGAGAAGIIAYPNPAKDRVHIAFEAIPNGELQFTLFNATGAVVRFGNLDAENAEVRVSDLAVGRYRLILKTNESVVRQFNLIKQ